MTTKTENVVCVYDEQKALVAIIKRDEQTGHKLVHLTNEAGVDQIARLINPEHGAV